ncbi:MAG: hypothetical protein BGO98_29435 [Myxococcales bacterium 68-20]|nr:MAG: hypothetical protein BGO98_29435 [Myxococcales bacterium 68-20]
MTVHPSRSHALAVASIARFSSVAGLAGVVLATLASTAACAGSRGAAVEAPVELAIAPIGSLPEAGVATNGKPSDGGRCSLRLVAGRIEKSSPGCYLDELVSKQAGLLHYPCAGDGPAEAEFGEQRYTGRVVGGEVELELSTELDWEDGCRWGTEAVITGALPKNGEPVARSFSWRYRDRVITGTDCSGVCTARTNIQVTSLRKSGSAVPAPHEDEDEDD